MTNYDVDFETLLDPKTNFVLIVLNESLNSTKSKTKTFNQLWTNGNKFQLINQLIKLKIYTNLYCFEQKIIFFFFRLIDANFDKKAKKRVLVDGANNWLFENYETFHDPDYICGDMDSISEEAFEFFKKKLSPSNIVRLADQEETDFDKSISFCLKQFNLETIDYFVTIWGQTGRIDHNLSCISTLIKNINRNSPPIYLIDLDNSLSCVLINKKTIRINKKSKWCSLIPVGEPSKISTTGFKWNLNDFTLKFGEFISTSNEFDLNEDHCIIRCDRPIFFSMHLPDDSFNRTVFF